MIFNKRKVYFFILVIGITLIIGLSQVSSSSYAFVDRFTIEKIASTATNHLLSKQNNSNLKDLKIIFLTDGLFSDAGWGAFGYNAAQSLEKKYGYDIDFKENVAIPDIEMTLREYANAGND